VPIAYTVFGWIFVAIGCLVYNLCAGWIGGIEVTLEGEHTHDLSDGIKPNEPHAARERRTCEVCGETSEAQSKLLLAQVPRGVLTVAPN
jgi:hypothetical protein